MKRPVEQVWDLTIAPDTVRLIVEKARTVSAAVNEDYADGAEHEIEIDGEAHDTHHHDGLAEEETEDQTERELRQIVRELNVDEAAELIALTWIGRGDYEAIRIRRCRRGGSAAQLPPVSLPAWHADARRLAGRGP